jgi:hypothetical protein
MSRLATCSAAITAWLITGLWIATEELKRNQTSERKKAGLNK